MSINFSQGDWWVPFAEAALGATFPILAPLIAAFQLARSQGHSTLAIQSGSVSIGGSLAYDPTLDQYIISGLDIQGAGIVSAIADAFTAAKVNGSATLNAKVGSTTLTGLVVYDKLIDQFILSNVALALG